MRKKREIFTMVAVIFAFAILLAGCRVVDVRPVGKEMPEEADEPEFEPGVIPWEEAGLQDHVISWHDSELKALMQEITGITDRDIRLSDLWELTRIDIPFGKYYNIRNITDLSGLVNIKCISLCNCEISDISALSSMTNLEILYLYDNRVSDISPLSGLTNLVTLLLQNNEIQNIDALSGLRKLQVLDLSNDAEYIYNRGAVLKGEEEPIYFNTHTNQISDISALSDLVNLSTLNLAGNQVSDTSVLSGLRNLWKLDLSNNQIREIELSGLRIGELILHSNQISDIAFSDLPSLRKLNLANNQISDISTLSNLENLTTLYLDYNRISDIDAISQLESLTKLYLSNNLITDVSALSDLNLSTLCLGCNQIVEIGSLPKTMDYLCLENNKISSFDAVLEMTNLKKLYLGGNVGRSIPTYISAQENSTVNHQRSGQVDY